MQQAVPLRVDVQKQQGIDIAWADGSHSHYSPNALRSMCPCAHCKEEREGSARRSLLTVLPGNYAAPITIERAEMVGNYALRIEWSDQHDAGIYSFRYLRELAP
jgi:DUF971 family protein